jgi:2-polyprenyl-3-methyl-5-hydroxy-6-metoxy-1,4-benzoquinol methylase
MDINEERNKRKKQTGEYFTPERLVRDMINKIPEEQWKDPTKTVLEPACGDGNFVEWIIRKKIECGSTIEQAINTTYAIDLMEDNVSETKKRVKRLILEFGGSKDLFSIVDNHIKCADFLKADLDELFPEQNLNHSQP